MSNLELHFNEADFAGLDDDLKQAAIQEERPEWGVVTGAEVEFAVWNDSTQSYDKVDKATFDRAEKSNRSRTFIVRIDRAPVDPDTQYPDTAIYITPETRTGGLNPDFRGVTKPSFEKVLGSGMGTNLGAAFKKIIGKAIHYSKAAQTLSKKKREEGVEPKMNVFRLIKVYDTPDGIAQATADRAARWGKRAGTASPNGTANAAPVGWKDEYAEVLDHQGYTTFLNMEVTAWQANFGSGQVPASEIVKAATKLDLDVDSVTAYAQAQGLQVEGADIPA